MMNALSVRNELELLDDMLNETGDVEEALRVHMDVTGANHLVALELNVAFVLALGIVHLNRRFLAESSN